MTLCYDAAMSMYARFLQRNPEYRKLWFAQIISLLGDWFNTIALSTLVAVYSGGSGLAISLFLMARFLPPLLVGPFAGVLVDRYNRKLILIWCNVLRTGVVLVFLLVTSADFLWLIYVLTIVQFMLSALFEPGQAAITPSLVKREDLVIANTLSSITWSSMLALGAIIGGVVATVFGWQIALVLDSLTFALAGFIISRIAYDRSQRVELDAGDSGSLRDGLRYLRANPITAAVLIVKGGGSLGNIDTLMTVYATQVFILGSDGELSLSFMYSAFGLGAILGPLVLNRVNNGSVHRMRRLIVVGFLWIMLGWLFLGLAESLVVFCIALSLRAMGNSANWTYSSVVLQKTVSDRYLGRVSSLDFAFFQLATVISTLAHGTIVDLVGTDQLPLVVLGTAVIALIPFVGWIYVLPMMEQREVSRAVGD